MERLGVHEGLRGLGVALVTPFLRTSPSIDHRSLKNLIYHVVNGGADFLVVLGTTGETATLSESQQGKVIEVVMSVNDGRLPIVIGCGGNDTTALCRKAKRLVATHRPDALLSVVPYYSMPTQEGIYQHFAALARAVPETPIILYNVPSRTCVGIAIDTILNLASTCPNIVGIKEASGDSELIKEIIRAKVHNFLVFCGNDALNTDAMKLGADGAISVLANAFPEKVACMISGDLHTGYAGAELQKRNMSPLIELIFREGNPTGIKSVLKILGIIDSHRLRLPLVKASAELHELIKKWLKVHT